LAEPISRDVERKRSEPVPEVLLERAAFALVAGQVVAIPTDTVYGLAVNPRRKGALEALFSVKARPTSSQTAVLVSGTEQAESLCEEDFSELASRIAADFWPGAVTLVLRRGEGVHWALGGDDATIGLRCPADPLARDLCERVGPLAATSANLHGQAPLCTAEEIRAAFGEKVALVVDGGRLKGLASTVVDVSGGELRCLREGAVPFADVQSLFD